MAICIIFFYITAVFMFSLIKIRKFINEIDPRKQMKSNIGLMNVNLISFAGESVVYLIVFVMSFYYQKAAETEICSYACRIIVGFDASYYGLWLTLITRTILTSYMNVKFSRELEDTNR